MFKPLGLLSHIPCPAHRNGSCEDARLACPFSHAPEAAPVHPPPTTPRTSTSSARAASPSHPQSAASSFRSAIKRTASDSSPTNARAGEASSAPQLKKARNAYAAKKADATANVASPAARDKGKAKADGTKAEDEDDGWTTVGVSSCARSSLDHQAGRLVWGSPVLAQSQGDGGQDLLSIHTVPLHSRAHIAPLWS